MVFKNEAQLKKFLIEKCKVAVGSAEAEIASEFNWNLNKFYSEYDPVQYNRTDALANSLKTTGVKSFRSSVSSDIYFKTPSYETGTWSGETVLDVALTSSWPHGGYSGGTAIWNEGVENLGDINELLIRELKKQGL